MLRIKIPNFGINSFVLERVRCLFDGVLVIPFLKNKKPVFILKKFCGPFFSDETYQQVGIGLRYDYRVYWKGEVYGHDFPAVFEKRTVAWIQECINTKYPTYAGFGIHTNWKEFRIMDFKDYDLSRYPHYHETREFLVKLKVFDDGRGASRPSQQNPTQARRQFLKKKILELSQKGEKPSVKCLCDCWNQRVNKLKFSEKWGRSEQEIKNDIKYIAVELKIDFVKNYQIRARRNKSMGRDVNTVDEAWKIFVKKHKLNERVYLGTHNDIFRAIAHVSPPPHYQDPIPRFPRT